MNDIQREIEIMQMVDHPNVIRLFEIYDEVRALTKHQLADLPPSFTKLAHSLNGRH